MPAEIFSRPMSARRSSHDFGAVNYLGDSGTVFPPSEAFTCACGAGAPLSWGCQMRMQLLVGAVVAALAAAPSADAQEQRAAIQGVVKDAQGGVLPGATVEARNAAGAVLTTVSDEVGAFRFPALAPGQYEVTATLAGFVPARASNVIVVLGQTLSLDLALKVGGVTEQVVVTAENPVVDVTQSSRSTNIREENIELLPKGRDFTTLVTQAPGANQETRLGGLSIDGASASENRYIVDGIETTDLQTGTSGKTLVVDFLEEVQVKSSGYPAEFGGATGGVVNAITKSGTNTFRGDALFYFSGSALEQGRYVVTEGATITGAAPAAAGGIPSLRRLLTDASRSEYVTYPEDEYGRYEPGIQLGGPIARNKAWFFGAYQPTFINTDRTVLFQLDNSTQTITQKDTIHYGTANQTAQLGDKLRTRVAFNVSTSRQEGLLPELDGSSTPVANFERVRTRPNYSVSANADYVATPQLYFGLKGGYYYANVEDENVRQGPLFNFDRSNVGFLDVPASLQRVTGFRTDISNTENIRDKKTRFNVSADATWFGNFGGHHQIKGGVQVDRLANDVDSGERGNLVRIFWNTAFGGQRGTYGFYRVRSNGVDPRRGFLTQGETSVTNVGLFLQDQWTINDRVTLNLGLRTERERVPSFVSQIDGVPVPDNAIAFDFEDKLAPRLGVAWDLRGDGRWKAFANWGIFYDIFKLELPRGSFGGDKWLEYWFTLDSFDWPNLINNPNCPAVPSACSGRLINGPVDARHPSNDAIDPGIKPMKLQEAVVGIEHQLAANIAVSARYIHKQIDRAVEDIGSLDAQGNELYTIGNPGEGLTKEAVAGIPYPKAQRDYDGVELVFNKLLSNNWLGRVSYLWSRLNGNYSGLSQADENGRTSPNVGRDFDYPLMSFTDDGEPNIGRLGTDRPHQFKVQAAYLTPWGTSVGVSQAVQSGVPVTRQAAAVAGLGFPIQYLGRLSDGRTDVFSQTDLQLQHEFRLGNRGLRVELNVLNLFNQSAGLQKWQDQLNTGVILPLPDESAFYRGEVDFEQEIARRGLQLDPRFLQNSLFQSPISARFGVRFTF
jgi:outer membrane receptor protein involved in Fe transport